MIKLLLVVGTRPNCIKVTQFKKVASSQFMGVFDVKFAHTGQYFDKSIVVTNSKLILVFSQEI